ncbi:hypothetical protein [Streptomyces sp. NPDC005262]|uniref:hypothetical protein n=1 Tax=Streptomyces sp. NPDC005262 TaxID=3364710 RepID=UPI003689871D
MLTSTIWARRPSRGQHDTCVLAALWPGEEHPAGWQLDFRDDDGNLLSIADQGGWARHSRSMLGYMQREDGWDDNASAGLT